MKVRSLHSKVSYKVHVMHIRKSVDSLCRNGTDAQYMQYLSKCRITNTLKAYLSTSSSSLSPFMIMQQDSYKCPTATQKTAKRKSMLLQKCLYSSSILRYDHSNNDDSKTIQVLTVILSQNWCLSQREAIRPSSVFTAPNSQSCSQHCPLRWTPFSNVVRMRTRSLVPKPKTTVIGLGARLAHVKSRVDQRSVRLVRSLPVVVAKAYAVHTT